jgi:hypothetical protein
VTPSSIPEFDDVVLRELRDAVTIHTQAFRRLLFDQPASVRVLADLFCDAGQTYLRLSANLRRIEKSRAADDSS